MDGWMENPVMIELQLLQLDGRFTQCTTIEGNISIYKKVEAIFLSSFEITEVCLGTAMSVFETVRKTLTDVKNRILHE